METHDCGDVFVCHDSRLTERKERLDNRLRVDGVTPIWVTDFAPDEIDLGGLDIRYPLTIGEISLFLKHKLCIHKHVDKGRDWMLVLEDDLLIPSWIDFPHYFYNAVQEFKKMDGDLLHFGTAFDMHPSKIVPNKMVYHEPHFTTRCAHAILYPLKTSQRIINDLEIIDQAYDWKLNGLISKYNLKSCYVEPGLFQTTVEGLEPTTIR